MSSVSIVVIGRNEEAYLPRCLRAVQAAAAAIGGAEIVYVDSVSTDQSVALAQELGVRVLSLRPEWPRSPAAGRYLGFHHTRGELILFVDADTVVEREFLCAALPFFQTAEVAGLTGFLADAGPQGEYLPYVGKRSWQVERLSWLRGPCSLYRRTALQEVRPFNPHLIVEEEAELAVRLQQGGWRLLHLPVPMACHLRGWYTAFHITRIWQLGRLAAMGRTLRYTWHEGTALGFVRMRLKPTLFFVMLWLGVIAGIALLRWGNPVPGEALLGLFAAGMLAVAIKKQSLGGPFKYLTTHFLILLSLGLGILTTRVEDPASYPLDAVELEAVELEAVEEKPRNHSSKLA